MEAGAPGSTVPWRGATTWSACHSKRFVAHIEGGASVTLSRDSAIVRNKSHSFPLHLLDLPDNFRSTSDQHFTVPIAPTFGTLSIHAAHMINQIPRLATVAAHVPADCVLLVLDTRLHREFVELFKKAGMIKNPVHYVKRQSVTFHAPSIFFAGEAVGVTSKKTIATDKVNDWYTLKEEICSWQLTSNRSDIRRKLDQGLPYYQDDNRTTSTEFSSTETSSRVIEALIVSREDAKSRAVENHAALVGAVKAALPDGANVRVFVGKDHTVESTERLWRQADLVVAPHGAAIAFVVFMRPKTLVIELGYHSGRGDRATWADNKALGKQHGMPWPAPYYWTIAKSADVTLVASMAQGSYAGKMTANLSDVSHIIREHVVLPEVVS